MVHLGDDEARELATLLDCLYSVAPAGEASRLSARVNAYMERLDPRPVFKIKPTCCAVCGVSLQGSYFEEFGKPYCPECYGKRK